MLSNQWQVLGRSQGPTNLDCCYMMDNSFASCGWIAREQPPEELADNRETTKREVLALRKGLVDLLDLRLDHKMSDES
jgi:hypothetical protein